MQIAFGELPDSQVLLHFDIIGQLKAINLNGYVMHSVFTDL